MYDIVYTYVNCNDELWLNNRNQAKELYYDKNINNIDSNINSRFNDNDELLYSLRSIDKYLPFIRNIYLVTDNQIPEWLDTDKIKVINHKDIIPEEFLPTFNSHVIELYLHKISNLSEPFLYFNDDVMIGKELSINDFITNDKINIYLNSGLSKKGIVTTRELGYRSAWKNSNKWLDNRFKIKERHKMNHVPIVIYKNIINKIWDEMYFELVKTSQMKFRSIYDYNILCSVYIYYCLYTNRGIIKNKNCVTLFDDDKLNNVYEEKCKMIKSGDADIFCINTHYDENFDLLNKIFSDKCKYEKQHKN